MNGSNRTTIATVALLLAASVMAGCVGTVEENVKTSCGGSAASHAADPVPLADMPAMPAPHAAELQVQPLGDPLKLGTMLPLTGDLAVFGAGMEQAAQLAIKHINDVGGVNGNPVELVRGDSRTDKIQAATGFTDLVNQGVAGVAGAASSGVTGAILPLAIDNEVFVMTPASTSPELTEGQDNKGWFARVPPSDALQGKVLAQMVYDDGCTTVAIIAINNPYGEGLGRVFEESFTALGGTVVRTVLLEDKAVSYDSQVTTAGKGKPDAIAFFGYPPEGSQVVTAAFEKGLMADSVFFFSEGVKDDDFVELIGKDSSGKYILEGLGGTTPEAAETIATSAFKQAYMDEYGEEPGLFAAETYDAIMAMALTAAYAGDNTGTGIKDNIRTVYNSPGTRVSGADAAAAFLAAHAKQDVDYVGASGDFNLDEKGDPASGLYSYWRVGADGKTLSVRQGIEPS